MCYEFIYDAGSMLSNDVIMFCGGILAKCTFSNIH